MRHISFPLRTVHSTAFPEESFPNTTIDIATPKQENENHTNALHEIDIPSFNWPSPASLATLRIQKSDGKHVALSQRPDETLEEFYDRYIAFKYVYLPRHPVLPSTQDFIAPKAMLSNSIGQNYFRGDKKGGKTSEVVVENYLPKIKKEDSKSNIPNIKNSYRVDRLFSESGYTWSNRALAVRDAVTAIHQDLLNMEDGQPKLGTISHGGDAEKMRCYAKTSFDQWRRRVEAMLGKLGSREEKISFCQNLTYLLYTLWRRPNLLNEEDEKMYKLVYLAASIKIGNLSRNRNNNVNNNNVIVADQDFYDKENKIITPGEIKKTWGIKKAFNRFGTRIFDAKFISSNPCEVTCRYSLEPNIKRAAWLCHTLFDFAGKHTLDTKQMGANLQTTRVDGGVIYGPLAEWLQNAVKETFQNNDAIPTHELWAAPPSMSPIVNSIAYAESHAGTHTSYGYNRAQLITEYMMELLFMTPDEGRSLSEKDKQFMMDEIIRRNGYDPKDPSKALGKTNPHLEENKQHKLKVAKEVVNGLFQSSSDACKKIYIEYFFQMLIESTNEIEAFAELLTTFCSIALQRDGEYKADMLSTLGDILVDYLKDDPDLFDLKTAIAFFSLPNEEGKNGAYLALSKEGDKGKDTLIKFFQLLFDIQKIKNKNFVAKDGLLDLFIITDPKSKAVQSSAICEAISQGNIQTLDVFKELLELTLTSENLTDDDLNRLFISDLHKSAALGQAARILPRKQYNALFSLVQDINALVKSESDDDSSSES